MNWVELRTHLEEVRPEGHGVDWADDLDSDGCRRLHDDLHRRKAGHDHGG